MQLMHMKYVDWNNLRARGRDIYERFSEYLDAP